MSISVHIRVVAVSVLLGVALNMVALVSLPANAQPVTSLGDLAVRIESLGCASVDFDTLMAVRQRQPGYLADYLGARCACAQTDLDDLGLKVFCWLLDCAPYRIPPADRDRIMTHATNCGYQPARTRIVISHPPTGVVAPGVNAPGKIYHLLEYMYNVSPESLGVTPIASSPITVAESIPLEQLAARVIPLDRFYHVRDRLSYFLPEDVSPEDVVLETCKPFVLVSHADHDRMVLRHVGRELVKAVEFYERTYELPPIEHAIVVHLLRDTFVLGEFARKYHGLQVPPCCIGYSFPRDASIVAVSPESLTGTLKHELLHVLLNPRFAGLPPWLEEGLASLYEESHFQGGRLLGVYGWRQRLMKVYDGDIPKIEELLGMDEDTFNSVGRSLDEQMIRHAMARTLTLWIQEQDRLRQVFAEFRPRCPLDVDNEPKEEQIARLARVLELRESDLESEFHLWFRDAR